MAAKKETQKEKDLKATAISEILKLLTASLGLVAALAWNQVAQEVVSDYIKPFFGGDSGVISLVIYAIIVTILAVLVAYFLTKFLKK